MTRLLAMAMFVAAFGALAGFFEYLQDRSAHRPAAIESAINVPTNDEASRNMAEALSQTLGVRVDVAPGEINQYLIRAAQGSVSLSRLGKVHSDHGYAVGVTLPDGTQIGLRYEPLSHQPR